MPLIWIDLPGGVGRLQVESQELDPYSFPSISVEHVETLRPTRIQIRIVGRREIPNFRPRRVEFVDATLRRGQQQQQQLEDSHTFNIRFHFFHDPNTRQMQIKQKLN